MLPSRVDADDATSPTIRRGRKEVSRGVLRTAETRRLFKAGRWGATAPTPHPGRTADGLTISERERAGRPRSTATITGNRWCRLSRPCRRASLPNGKRCQATGAGPPAVTGSCWRGPSSHFSASSSRAPLATHRRRTGYQSQATFAPAAPGYPHPAPVSGNRIVVRPLLGLGDSSWASDRLHVSCTILFISAEKWTIIAGPGKQCARRGITMPRIPSLVDHSASPRTNPTRCLPQPVRRGRESCAEALAAPPSVQPRKGGTNE